MAKLPVDATAFTVFDMQELDAGLALAGDELAAVFFWGSNRFNYEVDAGTTGSAPRARSEVVSSQRLRALRSGLALHASRRARMVLLLRGKSLGRATGWRGLGQFEAAVAAVCGKVRTFDSGASTGRAASGCEKAVKEAEKVRPIEKN